MLSLSVVVVGGNFPLSIMDFQCRHSGTGTPVMGYDFSVGSRRPLTRC